MTQSNIGSQSSQYGQTGQGSQSKQMNQQDNLREQNDAHSGTQFSSDQQSQGSSNNSRST